MQADATTCWHAGPSSPVSSEKIAKLGGWLRQAPADVPAHKAATGGRGLWFEPGEVAAIIRGVTHLPRPPVAALWAVNMAGRVGFRATC